MPAAIASGLILGSIPGLYPVDEQTVFRKKEIVRKTSALLIDNMLLRRIDIEPMDRELISHVVSYTLIRAQTCI